MKVLVCGSRHYQNYQRILACIRGLDVSLVIAGGCRGADTLAVLAARECGFRYVEYPADWQRFGRSAGPIRNQKMLDSGKPDFVLAFHEDLTSSRGTRDMLSRAILSGIPYKVFS
jgi:hypothetical protein